ncbi:MAG: hypothetical protein D3926_24705 [Desulfobacteraceae bacterium]|nr:MAG: hypothetical protein D3926_24705 [Desulfobacteraceae bacterium]
MIPVMARLVKPPAQDIVPRHRLDIFAAAVADKKVTLVTAGAGYGKTTFALGAIDEILLGSNLRKVVWYRPDRSDGDIHRFLAHLSAGIRHHYPDFWEDPAAITGNNSSDNPDIDSMAAGFLNALDAGVSHDLYLVIDDFHGLDRTGDVNRFLQTVLDCFPRFFHLVIITRSIPELKLSRLMSQRELNWVTQTHLAFDPDETGALLRHLSSASDHDSEVDDTTVNQLHQLSEGWATGLILLDSSLTKRLPSAVPEDRRFRGSQRLIFDYLEENVFSLISPDLQQFVLKSAILSTLHEDLCNRLLNIQSAGSILHHLEAHHLFTSAVDEDRQFFRFHPMFRDFLKVKLGMVFSSSQVAELYTLAAYLYEKQDKEQEALKHHILAGNMGDASRLLNHLARPIIKQNPPQMVKSLLSGIPEHYMDDEPWFQYLEAGYFALCNQLQMAAKGYEKVLRVFRSKKDEAGECICLMELAEYYMSTGDLKRSESAYKKILNKDKLSVYLTIIVQGYLIRVLTLLRKTGDADKVAKQAIGLLTQLDNEQSLKMCRGWIYTAQGFRHAYSGDYHKALELGELSKILFKTVGQYRFMSSSYFLISYACFYLGQFTKGRSAAREGIANDREHRISDEFSQFLHLLEARNSLEMEEGSCDLIMRAGDQARQSLSFFQENAFPGGVAQAFLVLHKACLKDGDVLQAESCLRSGIDAIEDHDMPLIKNELKVALSQLLFYSHGKERNSEAMALLKDAEQELLYSGWHMCWTSRIYARYYWEHGHKETAFKYMIYSLKISEEEGFDPWILSEKAWVIPLLVELLSVNAMPQYLKRIFMALGDEIKGELTRLKDGEHPAIQKTVARILKMIPQTPAPPITASFFGQFKLFVGDREVPASNWRSKKARDLFKYLLCMRHKGYLDKEILMELLWPDGDPKKSAQRFHVALASLRKTLEPDIIKGTRSSYIIRSGTAYRIDIGKGGRVDIDEFRNAFDTAAKEPGEAERVEWYKKAEAVYKGTFLLEDPYLDWCAEEREKYQQLYLTALKKLIEFHDAHREYTACITYANKYLKTDKYSETIIRQLMAYYVKSGNKAMAIQTYDRFKTVIRNDLDCSVSQETQLLYTQLVTV